MCHEIEQPTERSSKSLSMVSQLYHNSFSVTYTLKNQYNFAGVIFLCTVVEVSEGKQRFFFSSWKFLTQRKEHFLEFLRSSSRGKIYYLLKAILNVLLNFISCKCVYMTKKFEVLVKNGYKFICKLYFRSKFELATINDIHGVYLNPYNSCLQGLAHGYTLIDTCICLLPFSVALNGLGSYLLIHRIILCFSL